MVIENFKSTREMYFFALHLIVSSDFQLYFHVFNTIQKWVTEQTFKYLQIEK